MALIGLGTTATNISTAIKQPHEFRPIAYKAETFRRMANGAGRKDVSYSTGRWKIGWRNLTYAEWKPLEQYWQINAPIWMQDLEGVAWKVIAVGDLDNPIARFAGGTWRYTVGMTLEWTGDNNPTP